MKKFEWFDDIREADPSEENKVVIESLDVVIENINKIHTFQSMFENLGYLEYCPSNFENEYSYCYGILKDFLEKNFISLFKGNFCGMIPPSYYWLISFGTISIRINGEQMQKLLSKNYSYYTDRIKYQYDNVFEIKCPVFYDLGKNKFTPHV